MKNILSYKNFINEKYIGQCDRVRRTPEGEELWQNMMKNAKKISEKEFLKHADVKILLDDDETWEMFKSYHSDLEFYKSNNLYFIQTCGFEFIWSDDKINEAFKNEKNVKWYLKNMLKEIQQICPDIKMEQKRDERKLFSFSFSIIKKNIEPILKKYKDKLLRINIFMEYNKIEMPEMKVSSDSDSLDIYVVENGKIYQTYHVFCKEKFLKLVKPSEFVFHTSPEKNRESILEHGLLVKENLNYKGSTALNHPLSIFASLHQPIWQLSDNTDVWKIDTKNLPNKWYSDLNMQGFGEEQCIMTFNNIPKEYITLDTKKYKYI